MSPGGEIKEDHFYETRHQLETRRGKKLSNSQLFINIYFFSFLRIFSLPDVWKSQHSPTFSVNPILHIEYTFYSFLVFYTFWWLACTCLHLGFKMHRDAKLAGGMALGKVGYFQNFPFSIFLSYQYHSVLPFSFCWSSIWCCIYMYSLIFRVAICSSIIVCPPALHIL